MTIENDIQKYNEYCAETNRLLGERGKEVMRQGKYDLDTQFKDDEAFAQFFEDKRRADNFFDERFSTQRKMLIEFYEKQGIPEAAKVVDEILSRLNVEGRMRWNEIKNAQNAAGKSKPEGDTSNKSIPKSWIQWPSKKALADACGIVEKNMDYHIGKKHQLYVKNMRKINGAWYASRDCASKIKAATQTPKQASKSKKDRNK